eukprot:gene3664-biopygen3607
MTWLSEILVIGQSVVMGVFFNMGRGVPLIPAIRFVTSNAFSLARIAIRFRVAITSSRSSSSSSSSSVSGFDMAPTMDVAVAFSRLAALSVMPWRIAT